MDISGKTIMVLGGWGMVGQSICRRLIPENPAKMVVCSLRKEDSLSMFDWVKNEVTGKEIEVDSDWGDIFVRKEFMATPRWELLKNKDTRKLLIDDMTSELDSESLESTALYHLFDKHRPDCVIDCINTATAIAYQNVYGNVAKIRKIMDGIEDGTSKIDDLSEQIDLTLASLNLPQLIKHIQVLFESLKSNEVGMYLKIGTTGTGGMGFNIPYTHSEEKPSKMLLTKSAIAGAHSLLLFLMGRTPGASIVKEIKPATAIAWKDIGVGKIKRGANYINLFDSEPEDAVEFDESKSIFDQGSWIELKDKYIESVYIDAGENGYFSLGEFEAITTLGQMEFITPEEIAGIVLQEIKGINTGRDVISALDASILSPTYRAGMMREIALNEMKDLEAESEHDSIAFENLGPPRLTKLLYEAYMLKRLSGDLKSIAEADPEVLSKELDKMIKEDKWIRSTIISIGLPILLPEGNKFIRGPEIKTPARGERGKKPLSEEMIDSWCERGWIDLRVKNMKVWIGRAKRIVAEIDSQNAMDSSSYHERTKRFWFGEDQFSIGKIVGWIFETEESGFRMK